MSALRHDPLHDTWVIIAPDRSRRPSDQRLQTVASEGTICPFCPGHEHETPPEVLATGRAADAAPDRPPWRVRVCPNRYPAVTGPGTGHEVVVFSPDHERGLAQLGDGEIAEILAVAQLRIAALAARPGVAAVIFFQNAGAGAGASLAHPHGQLLATPVVPAILRTELAACAAWRREHGSCLVCDLAETAAQPDLASGLTIATRGQALAVAPAASRFAWEVLLMTRRHQGAFTTAAPAELHDVAALLGSVCRALEVTLGRVAYNLVLHTTLDPMEDFHWHLELLPRLAPLAGFETGTGFFINPVSPEQAARALRDALPAASDEVAH